MIWEYMNADHTHKLRVKEKRRALNLYIKTYWVVCSNCNFAKGPFFDIEKANAELVFGKELISFLEEEDPFRLTPLPKYASLSTSLIVA